MNDDKLKKIREKIREKKDEIIDELAFSRSKIEDEITEQYSALVRHLVALLHYRDPKYTNSWLKTIRNILYFANDKIHHSKVRITRKTLEKWIPADKWDKDIQRWIYYFERHYNITPQSDEYCTKKMVKHFLDKIYDVVIDSDPRCIDDIIDELREVVVNHIYDC